MQSVHEGVKYSCECCDYKTTKKATFNAMSSLSMMELKFVVNIVTIKQLQKATFKDMWNLSMMDLYILVNIVTIK